MTDRTETGTECTRPHADDGQRWILIPADQESVMLPMATQAVVLWVGDHLPPLIIDDNMAAADLRDYLDGARAHVWAARLRYWADALDGSTS